MYFNYDATVLHWVDGDTVDLKVDLGFHLTLTDRFRLIGIDTPERGKDGYLEARARVNFLAPAGFPVEVETFRSEDKYGRYLARVFAGPVNINQTLLDEKLAVPYDGGTKGP